MSRLACVVVLMAMLAVSGTAQARLDVASMVPPSWWSFCHKYFGWMQGEAKTVAELASQAPGNMSMLINAIDRAGLQTEIAKPEFTATILAPHNQAFQAALLKLKLTPQQLWADKTALTNILSYHVIKDKALTVGDLKDGQELETVQGYKIKVKVDKVQGTSFIGEGEGNVAKIVAPDLKGGKSVIHVVDTVLIPPSKPT